MREIVATYLIVLCLNEVRSCDTNWLPYNGHCYNFSPFPMVYSDAQAYCTALGSYMIKINDHSEHDFVNIKTSNDDAEKSKEYYIQGSDVAIEDTFVFDDGSPIPFDHWYSGNYYAPTDIDGTKNCLSMSYGDLDDSERNWFDIPCGQGTRYVVCEKDANHTKDGSTFHRYNQGSYVSTVESRSLVMRCAEKCGRDWACVGFTAHNVTGCQLLQSPCTASDSDPCYDKTNA